MSRHHTSPWFDRSQVFADTRRIDLFNDPPWEMPPPPARATATAVEAPVSRWASVKGALLGKTLTKRGQHSPKVV